MRRIPRHEKYMRRTQRHGQYLQRQPRASPCNMSYRDLRYDIFLFFNAAGYIVGYLSCYRQTGFCNDKDTQPLLPEIAFQSSQAAIRPEPATYVHCPSPTPSGRNDRGMAAERRIIRHKRRSIISSIAIIPLTHLFISPV